MSEMNKAADHFEAVLQIRFAKAMKQLQKETSINELALLIANKKPVIVDKKRIENLLKPIAKTLIDAMRHGGNLGARALKVKRG